MLTVQLAPESVEPGRRPEFSLELPPGLHAAMNPVWVPSLKQITWRLGVEDWGDWDLAINVDGTQFSKSLRATEELVRLSPERPPHTFFSQLEWPSETPFEKDGVVQSMTLGYPEASLAILGWDFEWAFAWMVVFFVLRWSSAPFAR